MTDELTCSQCGKVHPLADSELAIGLPDAIFALSKEERSGRCQIHTDVCVLDGERFFLRGLLPLPVHGRAQAYRVGVWAEISIEVFRRIHALWNDPAQSECSWVACGYCSARWHGVSTGSRWGIADTLWDERPSD